MPLFAVINGGTVVNLIDAPDLETASIMTNTLCVEYTHDNAPAIGDRFEETLTKKVK